MAGPAAPRRRDEVPAGHKGEREAGARRWHPGLEPLAPETRNVQRFRGGLVFKTHRLLCHSTLGLRVMKKKRRRRKAANSTSSIWFASEVSRFLLSEKRCASSHIVGTCIIDPARKTTWRSCCWRHSPHGGVRGFRWARIPGCYVTNFSPHTALKLIA